MESVFVVLYLWVCIATEWEQPILVGKIFCSPQTFYLYCLPDCESEKFGDCPTCLNFDVQNYIAATNNSA